MNRFRSGKVNSGQAQGRRGHYQEQERHNYGAPDQGRSGFGVRTERSIPYLISLDETPDVGTDARIPAPGDYSACDNEFNRTIKWVRIDPEPDDHSHLVDLDRIGLLVWSSSSSK